MRFTVAHGFVVAVTAFGIQPASSAEIISAPRAPSNIVVAEKYVVEDLKHIDRFGRIVPCELEAGALRELLERASDRSNASPRSPWYGAPPIVDAARQMRIRLVWASDRARDL